MTWVKWETICLPKEKGGLEVRDLASFNRALLGKWRWNLFHHISELWAKVLRSLYITPYRCDNMLCKVFMSIVFAVTQTVKCETRPHVWYVHLNLFSKKQNMPQGL